MKLGIREELTTLGLKFEKFQSQADLLAAEVEKVIAQAVNQEGLSPDEVHAALHPVAEHLRELAGAI